MVFWNTAPCSTVQFHQRSGETYSLPSSGSKSKSSKQTEINKHSSCELLPDYTTSHPRSQNLRSNKGIDYLWKLKLGLRNVKISVDFLTGISLIKY
jgi:hypothetical protein